MKTLSAGKTRNSNLDIIRSGAIYFVICCHSILNFEFVGSRLEGADSYLMLVFWILAHSCVPLFLMLSGYLMNTKKLSAEYYVGSAKLIIPYVIISLICLVFKAVYCHEEIGLRYIAGSIINFYACEYAWYLMMYLGLYFMIPFLNLMYHGLETQKQKLVLICVFFALSHLASLLNSYVQLYSVWWKNIYPISFYFVGAYLSEFKPRKNAGYYLISALVLTLAFSLFDIFHMDRDGSRVVSIYYDHYQLFIISVLLFCGINNVKVASVPQKAIKCTEKVSLLSFYVFLLSGITDIFVFDQIGRIMPGFRTEYWLSPLAALASFVLALMIAAAIYPACEKISGAAVKKLLSLDIIRQ